MFILLLQISFFIAILLLSTRQMAKYSKVIATAANISESVVGFFLLSVLTSMPEVIMSVTAVAYIKDVNLCGGNIFGSNLFNLSIFAFLNVFIARGTLFAKIPKSAIKALILGLGIAVLPLVFKKLPGSLGTLSLASVLIWGTYIWISRSLDMSDEDVDDEPLPNVGFKKAVAWLIVFSALMIISALILTVLSDKLSALTGWGHTFVGALLLAVVSSLPEMGISFHLIKLNSHEMVFGNILGSNLFNICVIALADIFIAGSIYAHLGQIHWITFTGILLQSLILGWLFIRPKKGYLLHSGIIGIIYIGTMFFLYKLG